MARRLVSMIPLSDDNPIEGTPYVTYALIGACILVFLYQLSLGQEEGNKFIYKLGVMPASCLATLTMPQSFAIVPPAATISPRCFCTGVGST